MEGKETKVTSSVTSRKNGRERDKCQLYLLLSKQGIGGRRKRAGTATTTFRDTPSPKDNPLWNLERNFTLKKSPFPFLLDLLLLLDGLYLGISQQVYASYSAFSAPLTQTLCQSLASTKVTMIIADNHNSVYLPFLADLLCRRWQ